MLNLVDGGWLVSCFITIHNFCDSILLGGWKSSPFSDSIKVRFYF